MLNSKQIGKIKEHLENAQNPVFFFDNDPDGLCSFLILRRYIERGKGVAIKSFPSLDDSYFKKVEELNADYIFILDKPLVSSEFFKRVEEKNIPVVWIDHHNVDQEIPKFVDYYNPYYNGRKNSEEEEVSEPVTAFCWQVSGKREDLWLAVLGCIADSYFPNFYDEFLAQYPDVGIKSKSAFEIRYKSRIGELISIVSNGLKDTTTNVVQMLKFLMKAKTPYDVLDENSKNHAFHYRHNQINKKYKELFAKAKNFYSKDKILFFRYSGDLSISGELSNELCYFFPEKVIVVAYVKGSKVNLSLRGKNIRDGFLKAIENIPGATGGGHSGAVGGQLNVDDLELFVKNLKDVLEKQ